MSQKDIVTLVAAGMVALGLIVHALFPRYEWRVMGDKGAVIVVYDRWGNYVQRAEYDEQGHLKLGDPFKPF